MKILLAATALLVAAPCAAGTFAAGKIVHNGSFETPVVPDGTYQLFNTGDSFTGWTVVGDAGNVAIVSGDFSYCAPLPAKKGVQWLDLTGTSNTPTGVQTTIATNPGSTYSITFFVGNLMGGGNCGTTSTVDLFVDGAPAGSFTNRNGQDGSFVWKRFSTQFTAQNATTTIAFMNGDSPDDTSNGLDGIVIRRVTAR